MKPKRIDLIAGRKARDQGIAQVTDSHGTWVGDACALLADTFAGSRAEMTGEEMRQWLLDEGFQEPHPNAWGAVVNTLCKRGVIAKTGRYVQMQARKSRARETPVWVFE